MSKAKAAAKYGSKEIVRLYAFHLVYFFEVCMPLAFILAQSFSNDYTIDGAVVRNARCVQSETTCKVDVPRTSIAKFSSLPLNDSTALFLHFQGSIHHDRHLVWVESLKSPFLSLNLDFNVNSLTLLSRRVHHMSVYFDSIHCPQKQLIGGSCVLEYMAKIYLRNVTKLRGVLCYIVDTLGSRVQYRCCKPNIHTHQIECDIPPVISPYKTATFEIVQIVVLIALLCLPAIFRVEFPDAESLETLNTNQQFRWNPFYRLANWFVKKVEHYSSKHHWVDVVKKLSIGLLLPTLVYLNLFSDWYTLTYDIPKMLGSSVKVRLFSHKSMSYFLIVAYNIGLFAFSFTSLPSLEKIDFPTAPKWGNLLNNFIQMEKYADKIDWTMPCVFVKEYYSYVWCFFKTVKSCRVAFCYRFWRFVCTFYLLLVSPMAVIFAFGSHAIFISPFARVVRNYLVRFHFSYWSLCFSSNQQTLRCILFLPGVIFGMCFLASIGGILLISVMFISKLIVYISMGLVVNKDDFFPTAMLISIFIYYIWHCFNFASIKYQTLLKQTYLKCKEHQENLPKYARKGLTFNEKGIPRISSHLFRKVMDEILPVSETYTIVFVKITIIGLFLCLIYYTILFVGESSLPLYAKTMAIFLSGFIPKLVEIFNDSSNVLSETRNECQVEKIVEDFLNSSLGRSEAESAVIVEAGETSEDNDYSERSLEVSSTTEIHVRNPARNDSDDENESELQLNQQNVRVVMADVHELPGNTDSCSKNNEEEALLQQPEKNENI